MWISDIEIKERTSFLDYIFGGCEMSMHIAVDLTLSNGQPMMPASLHYCDPSGVPNQYEQCIMAIGQILENYDSDQSFPMYGFGGIPPQYHSVSHCFALNGDFFDPEVKGIQSVI